jgi:hypothetical protein
MQRLLVLSPSSLMSAWMHCVHVSVPFVSQVLVLVAFILGCATASTLDSSGAHVGALSFAAVISSLV